MTEHNTDTDTATDSAQLAALEDRISSLESQLNDDGSFDPRAWLAQLPQATRRQVITAALSAVGIGAATQAAMAQTTQKNIACQWLGNQDAQGYNLTGLGTLEFADGTSMSSAATGGGALSDSGSDNTDGGDQYNLPQAEDSIDLQLSGDIENAASVTTDQLTNGVAGSNNTVTRLFGEHIQTNNPSSTSETAFTSGINSDYNQYAITFSLIPGTNNKVPTLQVSTDGGSSWVSGASAYKWVFRNERSNNSGGRSNGDGDSSIQLSAGVRSGSGEFVRATVWLTEPADSTLKTLIEARTTNWDDSGNIETAYVGGGHDSAAAVDGVRLQISEGNANIDSGTATLLGVMV